MIKGKTKSGFEFELEDDILDDYELLELLNESDKGAGNQSIEMVEKLLGKEQKDRLKDHIRTEQGRVSARRLFEEIGEIFSACNAGKNS